MTAKVVNKGVKTYYERMHTKMKEMVKILETWTFNGKILGVRKYKLLIFTYIHIYYQIV